MKKCAAVIMLISALIAAGCSVIVGKDDGDRVTQKGLSFRFVETLRNEASLRGESLRERANNTDRATTLQQPNNVYADAFRVYVTDASPARVFVFDRGERTVTVLDGAPPPALDEVKLIVPSGITVDAFGTIFISDSQQGRVFGYDKNGKLLFLFGGLGELRFPAGLAADTRQNTFYVADAHAHQVKVLKPDGTRLYEIGGAGKPEEDLKFPGAVALDRNGYLYVLDTLRRRVQVYNPDGKFMRGLSLAGARQGHPIKPQGIAVDSDGHLYVTDSVSNNIMLFDREGMFLFTWGRTGSLIGEFWTPAGIFIDDRDTIYIADQTNGRIQVYQYSR